MSDLSSSQFRSFPRTNPQIGWAVELRKKHRQHEAFIRGAGAALALLGGALAGLGILQITAVGSAYDATVLNDSLEILLGVSALITGLGLLNIKAWSIGSAVGGLILALLFLLCFWQAGIAAIALHLYVLALIGGKAGREILSFTYSQAVKLTLALERPGVLITHIVVTSLGLSGAFLFWMAKQGCP